MHKISDKAIRHIMKRHRDWIDMLGLTSEKEVKEFINDVFIQPDEVYKDRMKSNVRYFLKKLNDKFLCVIVVGDEVITAYIINLGKYNKYREGRWV